MIRTTAILLALAASGLMLKASPTIMPTRRPEFEPGFDLNQTLDDAGKRAERQERKADRKRRMQDLQRAAVEGRP